MTINKKKYKIVGWSISNLMADTPAMITRLQMVWAGLVTAIASSDYAFLTDTHTTTILLIGGFIDKIVLGGLDVEEVVK